VFAVALALLYRPMCGKRGVGGGSGAEKRNLIEATA
jgi:hypothetical protein